MKGIIEQLKDIMIEAAERDGNDELAKKLRVLRKKEILGDKEAHRIMVEGESIE